MYSLGLDIGTTSCKLCVVSSSSNEKNRVIFTEQLAHNAHIVQKDFASFDEQSSSKILETIDILLEKSGSLNNDLSIKSIQICGQMHGFILWSSKSPRTIVSPLVTWQDQRCTTEFLSSLGSSLTHLRTGYGLATLLWLIHQQKGKEDDLLKYDRAGTIADYVVTILCENSVKNSQISTQMATSWGALNNQWPIEHRLLPKIVEPGTIIGYWKNQIPVYVALGDLQCSVFSCQPENNEGVLNISTSAQLALAVDRQTSMIEGDNLSSSMRVPYFQSKDLLVAASLNGGNILSVFVQLIYSWQLSLNNISSLSMEILWSRLIELGLQSTSTIEHFSAALFGERHDPSMSASITNIRSINLPQLNDIGSVFRSICQWIINNLFEMLGKDSLAMKSVIGTGSALMRNGVLQRELKEKVQGQVRFNEHSDAAYGAALFALMQ
jgi:sedoheptulokinase